MSRSTLIFLTKESTNATVERKASCLKQGDEIYVYHDCKQKRCFITARPESNAVSVSFTVCPVRSVVHRPKRLSRPIRFSLETKIPVYVERTPKFTQMSLAKQAVLDALQVGDPPLSVSQIQARIHDESPASKFTKTVIKSACEDLKMRGMLSFRISSRRSPLYRLLIPEDVTGLFVVEHPGTKSAQYGWIDDWVNTRGNGKLPVVQFQGGLKRLSRDDILEPIDVNDPNIAAIVKRLRIHHQLANGIRPEGYVDLPPHLLYGLQSTREDKTDVYRELIEIAGYGGVSIKFGVHPNRAPSLAQNWMDTYYPGWNRGKLAFPLTPSDNSSAIAA